MNIIFKLLILPYLNIIYMWTRLIAGVFEYVEKYQGV